MFLNLLLVTFLVALAVSILITLFFKPSISRILKRILGDEIYQAWVRYMLFAVMVVGISSGVRLWDLEKYLMPPEEGKQAIVLNSDRWILELYRTIIGSLQGIAWLLLVFFLIALIGFIIVRLSEKVKGIQDKD